MFLNQPAETFVIFFLHVDEFDAAAVGADVADDGVNVDLVHYFQILAPGYFVGDEHVDAVKANGESEEGQRPGALGGLAASDVEFFSFAGGDETVIEVVEFDGGGGLDVFDVGEGDDGDGGSVASLEGGLPIVLD